MVMMSNEQLGNLVDQSRAPLEHEITHLRGALYEVLMMLAARPDMTRLMGPGEHEIYERARLIVNAGEPPVHLPGGVGAL